MLGEKQRKSQHQQVDNTLPIAKVVEHVVDEDQVCVRVLYPDRSKLVSKPLPVMQRSTKGTQSMDVPDVGTNVLVARSSSGLEDGYVLGEFYTTENPPPQTDVKKRDFSRFPDGSIVYFDTAGGGLVQDLKSPAHIKTSAGVTIEADAGITLKALKVTIDAPETELMGKLKVNGDIENTGSMRTDGTHTDSIGPHYGGRE